MRKQKDRNTKRKSAQQCHRRNLKRILFEQPVVATYRLTREQALAAGFDVAERQKNVDLISTRRYEVRLR